MKFSVECEVDSNIIINQEIKAMNRTKEFILIPNDSGVLSKVKIIAKVIDPQRFYSKIDKGTGEAKFEITINRDSELYNELISDLQELESLLSFSANLKRIHWERPKDECIPENDEEKEKIKILSLEISKRYPDVPTRLDEVTFQKIINSRKYYSDLTILKAFFREGTNEFKSYRYIYAFYNFYFILEDLYGGGKTKERERCNSKFQTIYRIEKTC